MSLPIHHTHRFTNVSCMKCEEAAEWYVWYKGFVLDIGPGNIAYNTLCTEHLIEELQSTEYCVEYVRRMLPKEPS